MSYYWKTSQKKKMSACATEYNKHAFKECTKVKRHGKSVILTFLRRIVGRRLSGGPLGIIKLNKT